MAISDRAIRSSSSYSSASKSKTYQYFISIFVPLYHIHVKLYTCKLYMKLLYDITYMGSLAFQLLAKLQ